MTPPSPDAPASDAQAAKPAQEHGSPSQEKGSSGSTDALAVKSKPADAPDTHEKRASPADKADNSPPKSPTAEVTEPGTADTAGEKPTMNGDGAGEKSLSPVGDAAKDADMTPKSPKPEPAAESPATAAPQISPDTSVKMDTSSAQDQKSEAKVADIKQMATEDTQMTDVPANESKPDSTDRTADDPPTKPTEPGNDSAPDTDMIDRPAQESATASQTDSSSSQAKHKATASASEVDLGPASMSQLAIESTEKESSPAAAPADVSMAEAPPSVKVARGRDEDADEEPAAKRARTEPKEDGASEPAPSDPAGVSAEVTVGGSEAPGLDSTALDKFSNWNDAEVNRSQISLHQRREMRKVIGRVKKTKAGHHFKDSVQKAWPALWDSYVQKIEKPMDLSELDRLLREPDGIIATYGDFKNHLALVFENCLSFNGPAHDITASAAVAVRAVWEDVVTIPAEEPTRPKAVPKPKPIRESRVVSNAEPAAKRQSAGPSGSAPSPVVDAPAVLPPTPKEPTGDRRSSTATDGDRPKRTVRAPKPKDIDYTTKPPRKKLKPELQFCDEVLTELMHSKHQELNAWFLEPVDAEGLNIPTYYAMIKKPMDLGKVQRMLAGGEITSLKEFDKNVRLIFDNCYKFNGSPEEGNPVSLICRKLEELYVSQMKHKDAWLSRHAAKNNAAAASASNASDEEDEEEDEVDDGVDAEADKKGLEELQAKLDEETKKLNSILVGGNQHLIDIQRNIVETCQNGLIKAAQAASARAKNAKSSKKSSKSSKAKSSGGSASRKASGTAAQPKKSGGSKKAGPKKSLNAAEKDLIANGINDLDFPHLDRAIEIIKKDTGQNENNDGELELDIDQLSIDALLKLWELCKKAIPGFGKDSAAAPNSSPEVNRGGPAKQNPKSGPKSKKNKPMSAQEQEARIAQLTALRDLYKPGQEPGEAPRVTQAPTPTADSSEDSDSEEE
ncbi:hypothetical protein HIM_03598 [Hirsutella minnesotensis 3608]|uniref:Bromo domain-containing protein n=1 Tax=Hirsutella minnesotensis 3608 TaxID=1043627 RepID=A0A0F8A2U2_9HYPO|nr:hypothetical protein HIM_03598 [Hirsutella minnesotensis 3608]